MRTTLNLDDDVVLIAKQLANRERVSLGVVVSRLMRLGVNAPAASPYVVHAPVGRFAILPRRDELITPEQVRDLLDTEGN
jgi:hypothetical protein